MSRDKKILFLTPYPFNVAPSQRLKFEQYYKHFELNGYEINLQSFIDLDFWQFIYRPNNGMKKAASTIVAYLKRFQVLFTLQKYDIVYVHLWVSPFGPPLFEWLVRWLSKKLIYDIDDLVYLKTDSSNSLVTSIVKGKNKPIYLMKHADHVITCTPYLDKFVQQYNVNTTDISSTIQTDKYRIANKYENNSKLTLGWSGSHSTAKYLYLLKDVLIELNKSRSFKLLVMGTDNFYIEGLEIESINWSEEIEIETIQRFDIGLYPLPDELWVHGKSGLKALQYMACGIPTVAMKVGEAIQRVITDKEDGFLVYENEEWLSALIELMDSPLTRKKIGEKARKKVVENYSIEANKSTYLNVLNSV